MRTVAAGYEAAIAASCVKVAEIYDIEFADGTTLYRTSHSEDIIWGTGGNIYLSKPIERGPVCHSISGEVETVEIQWSELDAEPYISIHKQSLTGAKWTIKRILWNTDYAVGWEIPIFVGFVNIEWDRIGIRLEGKSIFGCLNVIVPRDIYQAPCNRHLFDDICGLNRADYAYSGTATGGSRTTLIDTNRGIVYKVDFDGGDENNPIGRGDTITGQTGGGNGKVIQIVYLTNSTGNLWYVEQSGNQFVNNEQLKNAGGDSIVCNGAPAEDKTFYEMGELEILTGDNAGQKRPILANANNTVTVFWPFVNVIKNDDTYKIYPGCDKTAQTCKQRFGNDRNWRGFAFTSKAQERLFGPSGRIIRKM